jgi:serine/threonine-protein kinase
MATQKVLDFGLATLRAAPKDSALTAGAFETVAATVAGTMAYMPPEQIEGQQPDPRTDIFAFGVVLCELTTGTNPFARPSAIETLSAIGKTPSAAALLTARLAPGVAYVITKALAKRPEDRYQAMTEVLVDHSDKRTRTSCNWPGCTFSGNQA